jgi:hypothetical protein
MNGTGKANGINIHETTPKNDGKACWGVRAVI